MNACGFNVAVEVGAGVGAGVFVGVGVGTTGGVDPPPPPPPHAASKSDAETTRAPKAGATFMPVMLLHPGQREIAGSHNGLVFAPEAER